MNKLFINNLNDLIEIQRASYYHFLFFSITKIISKLINPFLINEKQNNFLLLYLYPNKIKFKISNYNIENCLNENKTYSIKLYILSEYKLIKENKINFIKKNIFLGEIPLITEDCTFIINGYEKIIINQLIRNPGIYFKKEYNTLKSFNSCAIIVSERGISNKFILENKNFFIPIYDLKNEKNYFLTINNILFYFGLNFKTFINSFDNFNLILNNINLETLENNKIIKNEDFYDNLNELFTIGEIGRYKINKKLNLNLPQNFTKLTIFDFINLIKTLIKINNYNFSIIDDIDDLKNKQIKSIGNFLEQYLEIGLNKIENQSNNINFNNINNYITSSFKEFFNTSELSQFMDQTNPLAELFHKRKINLLITNDKLNSSNRDIHSSYFGRFCLIETPEGQNSGFITSSALFSRINSYGQIETPYFLIQNKKNLNNKNVIYLDAEQEFKANISFYNNNIIKKHFQTSFKKNNSFYFKKINELFFMNVSPIQFASTSLNLIPFFEHNDSSRSLMGANMQRQAITLLYTQKPIVGSGLENNIVLDSNTVIKSYCEGHVIFVSANKIIIKDLNDNLINYYLKKFYRSNQKIAILQKPIVWYGEKVYSGQIIADGYNTNDGELSLGQNLLIAYMPWDGYNYEDAIVINEKIILNNCFTSLHIHQEDFILYKNEYLYNYSKISTLENNGLIKIGSYIKPNDILLEKIQPNLNSKEENLLIEDLLFLNSNDYKNFLYLTPENIEGCIIDIKFILPPLEKNEIEDYIIIKLFIAQIRKLEIGDKLSGRHGNKGIISKIISSKDMPFLPDGTPIDIIFNPLSIPSRMNLGQIFECLLGLSGEYLKKRFKILPFDEIFGKEASRILVYQKLKQAGIKSKNNWLFNNFFPGKIFLKDGRTGEFFDNPIMVGKAYILKLIHLVKDKINTRVIGPYSQILEQPIEGNLKENSQRFGEMEVWTLEAYGCSNTLQEILTLKSDDVYSRNIFPNKLINSNKIPNSSITESFLVLIKELNALGLNFLFKKLKNNFSSTIDNDYLEKNIFNNIENTLKLY